jgi:multicomponent Na+:H+ antiporter subunit E
MKNLLHVFHRNLLILFVLLLGLWLLMSGHYDFFHISMGVLSTALVVALNYRLLKHFFVLDNESRYAPLRFGRFLFYIPWLMWQIVIAALQVASVVLTPKMPLDPSLVRFKAKYPNTAGRVILANSITLTPGTITLELNDDEYLVHALMDVSSAGIIDGTLPGEVAKLFTKDPGMVVSDVSVCKSKELT